MGFAFILVACLALGAVRAEEMEFDEGLSADEIINTEFPVEYEADDGRTIDELIAAAGTVEGAAKNAGENQQVNFDMDMQMDPMQYAMEFGDNAGYAGAAMASDWYRWPKGIIPYKIQSGYTNSQKNTIYAGMQMWMRKTCIRFTPAGSSLARSTGHNHYITIFSGTGCYSYVGYNHRTHEVSLKSNGCIYKGIVAHELGHTIGLNHEQCRPDRDQYIKILLQNVPQKNKHNFNLARGNINFNQEYDYCSLMHYGRTAFGGGKFTIVPKDLDYLGTIGKSHTNADLTQTDAAVVNAMYGCNRSSAPTPCGKSPCSSLYSSRTCSQLQSLIG